MICHSGPAASGVVRAGVETGTQLNGIRDAAHLRAHPSTTSLSHISITTRSNQHLRITPTDADGPSRPAPSALISVIRGHFRFPLLLTCCPGKAAPGAAREAPILFSWTDAPATRLSLARHRIPARQRRPPIPIKPHPVSPRHPAGIAPAPAHRRLNGMPHTHPHIPARPARINPPFLTSHVSLPPEL